MTAALFAMALLFHAALGAPQNAIEEHLGVPHQAEREVCEKTTQFFKDIFQ